MSLLGDPEKMLPVVSVGLFVTKFVGSMNSRDYDCRDFDLVQLSGAQLSGARFA